MSSADDGAGIVGTRLPLGLVAAVQGHLEEWGARHGIEHGFHARGLADARLPTDVETAVYRVVQEGLTNVLKHASATRVDGPGTAYRRAKNSRFWRPVSRQ